MIFFHLIKEWEDSSDVFPYCHIKYEFLSFTLQGLVVDQIADRILIGGKWIVLRFFNVSDK